MDKLRIDSWASALSEDQAWSLYDKSRRAKWQEAVEWAQKEFGLEELPGRSAFYRWQAFMRSQESAHRLEQQRIACLEAAAIAKESPLADKVTIEAYKQMAVDVALRTGNAKDAKTFVDMAMAISDRTLKAQELKLKTAAQTVKEDELKLAREKFEAAERRLNDAQKIVVDDKATPEEKIEQIKEIFGGWQTKDEKKA